MRIDAATYLGAWPLRDLEGTTRGLRSVSQELQLDGALVSPLPALFHTDPESANDRLLRGLAGSRNRWAVPVVNARLAGAARYMARLAESPSVRGVRLAPGFHGYAVEQAEGAVQSAADHGLAAVLQLRMQDERSHPVTSRVPPAPLAEVIALAGRVPKAHVVVAAARMAEIEHSETAGRIRGLGNLWLDISHLDGLGCLRRACKAVGARRLLFATSWPFFCARSALLKVEEAQLPQRDLEAIMGANAAKAFGLPVR